MSNDQDLEVRVDALIDAIQNYCSHEVSDEVQHLLADLIRAINLSRKNNELHLVPSIEIAFRAATAEKPSLILARDVSDSVLKELRSGTKFSPPVRVIIGLGFLLFVTIPALLYILPKWMDQDVILTIPTRVFLMVAFFGAFGSIVSIMIRIQEFSTANVKDHFILYSIGFFKPIIGLASALFLLALIKSGWIPLEIKAETENYLYIVVAFIAGFSERFARDIVSNIETRLIKASEGGLYSDSRIQLEKNDV